MNAIQIRKPLADDLPEMQEIARRTIDTCCQSFLGNEAVDWYINSGESDKELLKHIDHCELLEKIPKLLHLHNYG